MCIYILSVSTPSPVVMAPYNPPYSAEHLGQFGLVKVKDLLCWYVSEAEGYKVPERILHLTEAVQKRYNVRIRQLNMKRYDEEVKIVIELANSTIIDNWGFSPVTEAEVQAMARDMRPVLQPKGVLFAEDADGKPIGFAITLPDVNTLLKGLNGHLFPFGFLKLLTGIPRLRHYRMFALGVIPEYQGKAVDSLLYRAMCESLYSPDIWMEINYVLEDNWPMVNAIKKLGCTPLRRYRVYEMKISRNIKPSYNVKNIALNRFSKEVSNEHLPS
jgi:ribosomal protein S18 acetylase RimI-like enzyme